MLKLCVIVSKHDLVTYRNSRLVCLSDIYIEIGTKDSHAAFPYYSLNVGMYV